MQAEDLTIISPTFYTDERRLKYFQRSAALHSVGYVGYGWGMPFTDWIQTHITECLKTLSWLKTDYVLFTDSSDVIFLQGEREICNRYERLGRPPMLVSMESDAMNAGGWMGEVEVARAILEYLATTDGGGDPQQRWRWAVLRNQIRVERDRGNVIFSVNTFPSDSCLLHLAGGYTDPVTGKEDQLKPVWEKLGYDPV